MQVVSADDFAWKAPKEPSLLMVAHRLRAHIILRPIYFNLQPRVSLPYCRSQDQEAARLDSPSGRLFVSREGLLNQA